MKAIELTQGKVALVDDADYECVSRFKWRADRRRDNWYARATINGKNVYLHRYLVQPRMDDKVDHWDGNGLNCARSNLRVCGNQKNCWAFHRKRKNTTSRFHGVSWIKRDKKWRAWISTNGKQLHLGVFDSEIAAAEAYNVAALTRDKCFHNVNQFYEKGYMVGGRIIPPVSLCCLIDGRTLVLDQK